MSTGQAPWGRAQHICIVMKQGTACMVRHPIPLNGACGRSRILRLVEDVKEVFLAFRPAREESPARNNLYLVALVRYALFLSNPQRAGLVPEIAYTSLTSCVPGGHVHLLSPAYLKETHINAFIVRSVQRAEVPSGHQAIASQGTHSFRNHPIKYTLSRHPGEPLLREKDGRAHTILPRRVGVLKQTEQYKHRPFAPSSSKPLIVAINQPDLP